MSIMSLSLIIAGPSLPSEDSDEDGVPDPSDLCPATEAEAIVNADGCSIAQSIAQLCLTNAEYRNHGGYVSCVAHMANAFVKQGLILSNQAGDIISEAAQSNIGK